MRLAAVALAVAALACGDILLADEVAAPVASSASEGGELLSRRVGPLILRRKVVTCEQDATRLREAFAEHRGKMDNPAEQVVIPLMSHSDGTAMVEVQAEKAQRFEGPALDDSSRKKRKSSRFILCQGVTLRQFDQEGGVSAEVRAPECFIDLATGSAWFEGTVNGRYNVDYPFTGDGIYFSSEDFFVKIYSKVEITVAQ